MLDSLFLYTSANPEGKKHLEVIICGAVGSEEEEREEEREERKRRRG
jgi:hypothetical protein